MDAKKQAAWDEWLSTRPPIIQEIGRRFPPDKRYRLKSTGQVGYMQSAYEDGTVRMEYEPTLMMPIPLGVFGIDPNDLEPVEE